MGCITNEDYMILSDDFFFQIRLNRRVCRWSSMSFKKGFYFLIKFFVLKFSEISYLRYLNEFGFQRSKTIEGFLESLNLFLTDLKFQNRMKCNA